jgi:hypothetical protein
MFRLIHKTAIAIVVIGELLVWSAESRLCAERSAHDEIAKTPSGAPVEITIYDPDPHHLWNRLHRVLWVRVTSDRKEFGADRLDPYLWHESRFLLEGKSHEQALAILDEFLTAHGENLIKEPIKRAILQRDLWALFDWTADNGEAARSEHVPPSCRALQERLARVIRRLALTRDEIKGLPDNYVAASHSVAQEHDPDHPERPFLPPDLFQEDGPWVEVGVDGFNTLPAARHVLDFGARSAFRVFLRFPEGRKATLTYFAALKDFPQLWVPTREPDRKRETLKLNPALPQFPVGTQTALVRQMLLIDEEGKIATTGVTESVQLRVFRKIEVAHPEARRGGDPDPQDFYEFTRSRALLFAGKSGGLRPLGRNEKDFATQLLVHAYDPFEENGAVEDQMQQPMRSCLSCHDRPGVYSFRTFTGGVYPRGQYHVPDLRESYGAGEQGDLTTRNKHTQYSWGLLQGQWRE